MNLIKEYRWWLLFIVALIIAVLSIEYFFSNDKNFDVTVNWEKNKEKILSAKQHFESITNKGYLIYIEYASKDLIEDIQLTQFGGDNIQITAKNVTVNSPRVKEICRYLNWSISDLQPVYEKLAISNCSSIANTSPFHIGYKRDRFGKYSYAIFDRPIADSMFKAYNDTCRFKYYNSNLILEYGGGAIGPQCFPKIAL